MCKSKKERKESMQPRRPLRDLRAQTEIRCRPIGMVMKTVTAHVSRDHSVFDHIKCIMRLGIRSLWVCRCLFTHGLKGKHLFVWYSRGQLSEIIWSGGSNL
ncbi:hypothetical protein TNCV_998661 [Trichonephila clavipes]|nr:hypothetical protein TNCV_998661 [Trichonephila clavipes]